MNLLGLVFSIMLILSYGFYACWDKHTASTRLRNTFTAAQQANRKILNSFESEVYNGLDRIRTPGTKDEVQEEEDEKESPSKKKKQDEPDMNRTCSRINLWPLIQDGRESHPALYELAAKLIRTFYGQIHTGEKRFEYQFLDLLISSSKTSLKEDGKLSLEKLTLLKPEYQRVYYKMLKGTKNWDLREGLGYPPLQDYVKVEPSDEKICVSHAHPDLLTVLFNAKIGWKLHAEIHQKDAPALTRELIEKVCSEMHLISVDEDLLKLLELGYPYHEEQKKAFIAEDEKGNVSLRKNLYLDRDT
jgi:hypothetical protein